MRRRVLHRWLWASGLCALAASCSSVERPPRFHAESDDAGQGGAGGSIAIDSGREGPPPLDAPGFCGNEVIPVIEERPNLYFILDRSGSMAELLIGSGMDKYTATRVAVRDMLKDVGHRVNYGAAVFPPRVNETGCEPGIEVFPTVAGDPLGSTLEGRLGPTLTNLLVTLANLPPEGGTPTAGTLASLRPLLTALPHTTAVVLATDGAPNCNGALVCGADRCQQNIERAVINGRECTPDFNCCDPSQAPNATFYCVDDDGTDQAVKALALANVKTYVIGMPGSEHYAGLLERLAVSGQTAREGSPRYYAVSDVEDLTAAVRKIGVEVAISCAIALDKPPPDQGRVNVYFDTRLVPADPDNGWAWTGDNSLELRGSACDDLKSGNIQRVQVVSGCPTKKIF
jgi:hypothetical protein